MCHAQADNLPRTSWSRTEKRSDAPLLNSDSRSKSPANLLHLSFLLLQRLADPRSAPKDNYVGRRWVDVGQIKLYNYSPIEDGGITAIKK